MAQYRLTKKFAQDIKVTLLKKPDLATNFLGD
jgi:hypothetical protein